MMDLSRIPEDDFILLGLFEDTIIGNFESLIYVILVIGIGDSI